MKTILFISILLLSFSCEEKTIPKESNYVFQLPEKEIFVKATKYKGGKFTLFFAPDSLSLNNSKDSIEYITGSYIRIIVDITDIYADSNPVHGTILNKGENHFNIEFVSDSVFQSFFEDNIQKYPYSFIGIDTKEYGIGVNQQTIKKGNMYGGW